MLGVEDDIGVRRSLSSEHRPFLAAEPSGAQRQLEPGLLYELPTSGVVQRFAGLTRA